MHNQMDWGLACKVCRESIRKWSGNARIWAIVYLVCMFAWVRIEYFRAMCESYGLSVSCWYFPFQMSDIHALFYYFGLLLLFCDAPFIDNQQMDVILRAGKRNWFVGKILYIVVASCLYFFLVCLIGIMEFFPYVGFSWEWEDMFNIMSLNEASGIVRRLVITSYTPVVAWLVQYVVCVLFAILLGLLIFYFNLFKRKLVGLGLALTLVLMGGLLYMVDLRVSRILVYLIPMTWTNIDIYVKEAGGVPLAYAISMLCIGVAVFVVLIIRKSKSYNIECQEEM